MNAKLVEDIASAVLYEGYILYPYRASAVKNQQRWNFGVLYPRAFSEAQQGTDAWSMQTECLARAIGAVPSLNIRVRFLHLINRTTEGESGQPWQEATERDVDLPSLDLPALVSSPARKAFSFPASCEKDGKVMRTREQIAVEVDVDTDDLGDSLFRVRVRVRNGTPLDVEIPVARNYALMRSLVSVHTILEAKSGEFVSLLDPPEELRDAVARCENVGTWPVLVGEAGERDAMLSSPIILYDYPQIAPESAGALFDGTEIDEILTLRIMTLSDEEKLEMDQVDKYARRILERTEAMPPEQLMKMHGALRGLRRAESEAP
jgi:hydrogenase maturation protease